MQKPDFAKNQEKILFQYRERKEYILKIAYGFEDLASELELLLSGKADNPQEKNPCVKLCLLCDSNTKKLILPSLKKALSPFFPRLHVLSFPAGEEQKNQKTLNRIYRFLLKNNFSRGDCILSLGGGTVGDIGGFAAATYLRGLSHIQIPSTLLAMTDASLGGKTGIDYCGFKNMIGAFYMPSLVYINIKLLFSLPEREFASGMAEVLKHALIASASQYRFILSKRKEIRAREPSVLYDMLQKSIETKKKIVESDPLEKGERALLNFGHTLGHAIEKESAFSLRHGEAVALGMLAAMQISVKRGYLNQNELEEFRTLLQSLNLPVFFEALDIDHICESTWKDKKRAGEQIRFILLKKIGEAFIDRKVDLLQMKEALDSIYGKK
ncbi:MAG: 3-dehydroquinate synthase [Johnsonella sp.]|nr:3-dehydroquinate synthase [Johnsonella sp.]